MSHSFCRGVRIYDCLDAHVSTPPPTGWFEKGETEPVLRRHGSRRLEDDTGLGKKKSGEPVWSPFIIDSLSTLYVRGLLRD